MLSSDLDRAPLGTLTRWASAMTVTAAAVLVAGGALAAREVQIDPNAPSREWKAYVQETQESLRVLAEETGALAAASASAAAQAGSASISGRISDPLSGFIPGALVSLTSQGRTIGTRADGRGAFTIAGLRAGDYTLEASLPGFRTHRETVVLRSGERAQKNVTLQLGSLQETITIIGSRSQAATPAGPRQRVRTPPAGATPPPDPCIGAIGGCIRAPAKIRNVPPIYPAGLQSSGVVGVVILQGTIDVNGLMTRVKVLRSPDPGLTDAAVDAFNQWEFLPTRLNGVPIEADIVATFSFDLEP